MPRVYYGLQQGEQTYRFLLNFTINEYVSGNIGDAFLINSTQETSDYISAIATMDDEFKLKIIIQGDYNINTSSFVLVNMRTGDTTSMTIEGALLLQEASSLANYPPEENQKKQVTVLKCLELNKDNVVFASVDINSDGTYNWIQIGGYINGLNGKAIYNISESNYDTILTIVQPGDMLIAIGNFTKDSIEFGNYNLYSVSTINPLTITLLGNIKGEQGETGAQGAQGVPGENGITPHIQNGFWYIGDVNTNVQAVGINGTNGKDGQSFLMQSGLYSAPENVGKENNTTPEGGALKELPTLPQTDISGKGFIVFDQLTTPLQPYYDLYYANDNDTEWTIIHPFNGINGADGQDGFTPYIQNNNWWINGVNTGIPATGPQGIQGVGIKDVEITPKASNSTGNMYDMTVTLTDETSIFAGDFEAPQGAQGAQGASINKVVISAPTTVSTGNQYTLSFYNSDNPNTPVSTTTFISPRGQNAIKYYLSIRSNTVHVTNSNTHNKLSINASDGAGMYLIFGHAFAYGTGTCKIGLGTNSCNYNVANNVTLTDQSSCISVTGSGRSNGTCFCMPAMTNTDNTTISLYYKTSGSGLSNLDITIDSILRIY